MAQLLVYLPFKDTSAMISVLVGEFATVATLIATTFYLTNLSSQASYILEMGIIFTIIAAMCIQFLASIYSMIQAFQLLWHKILKYKAQALLKAHEPRLTAG